MKNKNDNYSNEYFDWQKHQYDPGYYTGGKVNPVFKFGKNKSFFRIAYLVLLIIIILFVIFLFYSVFATV